MYKTVLNDSKYYTTYKLNETYILFNCFQTPHLEIKHLQNECTYNVNVRNIFNSINNNENGARLEFFATGCSKQSKEQKDNKLLHNKIIQCKTKSAKRKRHYATYF